MTDYSDRAADTLRRLLPDVVDQASVADIAMDLTCGEPIVGLVSLLERHPEIFSVGVVDDLEQNVAHHETTTGRVARAATAAYRASPRSGADDRECGSGATTDSQPFRGSFRRYLAKSRGSLPIVSGSLDIALTGAFTLGGVIVGQVMSTRANRDTISLNFAEERRIRLHGDLAELVTDTRTTLEMSEVLIPGFWKMSIADLTEWVDTDSGRAEAARRARIAGNLVKLGLGLADGPLRDALREFELLWNDWAEKATGPVNDPDRKNDFDAVLEGLRHLRATRSALKEVQLQAALALAVGPVADLSPTWGQLMRHRASQLGRRRRTG